MPKPSDWEHHKPGKPKNAFDGFDIATVASYDEAKINALIGNPAVIRNRPKIHAIVSNARELQAVIDEQGEGGEEGEQAAISKRCAFMGKSASAMFMHACGEEVRHP